MRWLVGILLLLTTFALPSGALAHAQLRASEPTEGSLVDTSPARIVLTFNEPVSPVVLRLIGPDGTARDVDATAENEALTVTVPDVLDDGTHLLSWRVVSSDGHPLGGTLTFHIGAASATPPALAAPASGPARAAAALRLALTTVLVVTVGAAVFAVLVQREALALRMSNAGQIAAVLTVPIGTALLAAQGLDLLSLPPSALLTTAPWQSAFAAPLLLTVVLTIFAGVLSFLALRTAPGGAAKAAALAAWCLAALSFAVSGHAAAALPRWLTAPAIALHALALIFWLGALLPLLAALRYPRAAAVLQRFSTLAVPLVATLVASGALITWAQTGGDISALLGSTYGAVLGAKLILVLTLLALAARNRLVLTPALERGIPDAAPRLARAIRIEILAGLVILALASGFRLTPPPRALVMPAEPLFAHIHTRRLMVDVALTPGRAGPVELELGFQNGDFGVLVPKEVEVTLSMPEIGIEPIRVEALLGNDGLWRAGPVTLPTPGDWVVSLRILITDFESVLLQQTIRLEA